MMSLGLFDSVDSSPSQEALAREEETVEPARSAAGSESLCLDEPARPRPKLLLQGLAGQVAQAGEAASQAQSRRPSCRTMGRRITGNTGNRCKKAASWARVQGPKLLADVEGESSGR